MIDFNVNRSTFVIAEIGANHNGDMEIARKMIDSAKSCGADAVKFQSWDTTLFSKQVYDENKFLEDDYRDRNDYTLREIMEEFMMSYDQFAELKAYCDQNDIVFSSTPFSVREITDLVKLGVEYLKIASMDLTNPELLEAAGGTGLPILLSTGFGTLDEIERAVRIVEDNGGDKIVLLHCVSLYPPDDSEVNLNNMDMLRSAFGYPVGFSDHTLGTEISIASIAKGAIVLEKHFTTDKTMFGWDHHMSADPLEMTQICNAARRIDKALGSTRRVVGAGEREKRDAYRRSVVAARTLKKGEVITRDAIAFRRPGTGISPMDYERVVGMTAAHDISDDMIITDDDLVKPAAV